MTDSTSQGDVLLVHLEKPVGTQKRENLEESLRAIAKQVGMTAVVLDGGMRAEVNRDLSGLVAALEDQTRAMRELAESNRAVVDYLLAQEAEEHDEAPDLRYLDGSPKD